MSGSNDGTINVWDIANPSTPELINHFKIHDEVKNDSFTPQMSLIRFSDQIVVSGGNNGVLTIWDLSNPKNQIKKINSFKAHSSSITCFLKFHENVLISGGKNGLIQLWDFSNLKDVKLLNSLTEHSAPILSMIQIKDNIIFSWDYAGFIKIWDFSNYKKTESILSLQEKAFMSLIQFNDQILISGHRSEIILWNFSYDDTRITLLAKWNGHSSFVTTLLKLNENIFISGSDDKFIKIWNALNPLKCECVYTLEGHSSWVLSLLKINDNIIISGSDKPEEKNVKIWDLCELIKQPKCIGEMGGHMGMIWSLVKI